MGGLGLVTAFSAWLLWSWTGVLVTLVWIAALYVFAPRLPPEMIMRMYRARPLDPQPRRANRLHRRRAEPAGQAAGDAGGLCHPQHDAQRLRHGHARQGRHRHHRGPAAPAVAARARRRAGARAEPRPQQRPRRHEPGRRHDPLHAGAVLSGAVILAIFNLPAWLLGDSDISLSALLLLYLAPTIGSLLQLGLSRTREYDADLEGAQLTGDPRGLASALEKLERYQGISGRT